MDINYFKAHVKLGILTLCGYFVNGDHRDRTNICDDYYYDSDRYSYCDEGYYCCEDNTKCCKEGISVAVVIGIVMGSLFFIGLCLFCSVALTKKKKLRPRQMITPMNNSGSPGTPVNQLFINNSIYTVGRTNRANRANRDTRNTPSQFSYGQSPPPYVQSTGGQYLPYEQSIVTPPSANPVQPPPYSQNDYAPPPAYSYNP
ncbi:hypothetical protein ACF0H5_001087 [Mactra antiquata]